MGGNLGPPIGGIIILLGFSCLFFTICLKKYCKEKFLNQIIIELVLIIIIVFCVYRKNEKILLHLPENFTGDIIVVYEVDKAPKLESTSFFNPNIHVKVPENGKIFTSNNRKYNIIIIDSSKGKINKIKPGYDIAFLCETLQYNGKKYFIDRYPFKSQSSANNL